MKKSESPQPLIGWRGDTASLVAEMKRRAGVETDSQLAAALGKNQSAVSHWRRKGAVPEAVLLGFDEAVERHRGGDTARALAARAIAIRLADFMFHENRSRSPTAGRWVPYMTVAMGFHSIVDAVCASLAGLEDGRSPNELAEAILEDEAYLKGLAEWARGLSLGAAIAREAKSPPVIQLPPLPTGVPHMVPQSKAPKRKNG